MRSLATGRWTVRADPALPVLVRGPGLAAAAGAGAIRYGFPWYRLNPAPGRFVWDWADRVVDRLDELGLEAIVDLIHYGTPLWLDNAFLNADFPVCLAEYAAALAERYRGRLRLWTPMNEPQITAMHCGELGIWPPRLTGHDGYVKLIRAIVRGVVAAQRAVAEASGGRPPSSTSRPPSGTPARPRPSPRRSSSSGPASS